MKILNPDKTPKPQAIRRLYEVFARYPARSDMPRCEHCATKDEIARLCATPLAELTEGSLNFYSLHAISTVGEVVDFKHFLPRMFESMLWGNGAIDVEIIVGKLPYGRWREWPSEEQAAISAFFSAWWSHLLSHYPAEHEAEECLCAIAQAEDDISRFLDFWRQCTGPHAMQHLAATMEWNYCKLMDEQPLFNAWWQERPKQMSQLRDWLLSPLTGKALEEAFFKYAEQPFAKLLSDGIQQFGWVQLALAKRGK